MVEENSLDSCIVCSGCCRLVGRSIQGIGGGGILTLGEIVVTDLVPLVARGSTYVKAFPKALGADVFKPCSDTLAPFGL